MTNLSKKFLPFLRGNYWMAVAWVTMALGQCRLDRGPDDYISPIVRLTVNLAERLHVHMM